MNCKVIPNEKIKEYVDNIPDENKQIATKVAPVAAREGKEGEVISTFIKCHVDGKEYILGEEQNEVKNRDGKNDIVVTNINSTSDETYVVKANKFSETYTPNQDGTFTPVPDERELTRVDENVIIMTSWGSEAICLAGSYIVTYNAEENDFHTLEEGAYNATYKKVSEKKKYIKI